MRDPRSCADRPVAEAKHVWLQLLGEPTGSVLAIATPSSPWATASFAGSRVLMPASSKRELPLNAKAWFCHASPFPPPRLCKPSWRSRKTLQTLAVCGMTHVVCHFVVLVGSCSTARTAIRGRANRPGPVRGRADGHEMALPKRSFGACQPLPNCLSHSTILAIV
jgi:hypothetical protein